MTKGSASPEKEKEGPIFRESGFKASQIRLLVAIFVSVFVCLLVGLDFGNEVWRVWIFLLGQWIPGLRVEYWIQLSCGMLVFSFMVSFMLYWEARQRARGKESWLGKYGDEIGWPLMILGFLIQFLFPFIRPFLLGGILASSWVVLLWYRKQ